jgi:hypothetical protein
MIPTFARTTLHGAGSLGTHPPAARGTTRPGPVPEPVRAYDFLYTIHGRVIVTAGVARGIGWLVGRGWFVHPPRRCFDPAHALRYTLDRPLDALPT